MKKNIILIVAVAVLSGCVSAGKYKAQETKLGGVIKELDSVKTGWAASDERGRNREQDLKKQIEDLNRQTGDIVGQLDSANAQITALQKSNKDLQESLDAKKGELSKKLSDMIKERDELSKKLTDMVRERDEFSRKLTNTTAAMDELKKLKDEELARAEEDKKVLEREKEAELAKVKRSYEDLTSNLKSEISAGEVTITQLKGKLTVNMVDRILFDSGMAEVRKEGKKVLDSIGKVLNGITDKDIRIEGHTDNVPIKGDLKNKYATNWELSTARATAVARYLQDNDKVDPVKLVATGYGEFRPVAPNDTPENKALNRRIEIVLVPKD